MPDITESVTRAGRLVVVFLLLPFVWACGGPYYFDLHLESPKVVDSGNSDKVLLIEDVEINQTYQDSRIVYRESPFQVKYDNFTFWSKSVDELIEDATVDFWRKSQLFKKVNVYGSSGDADLILSIKINAIEKCFFQKKWFARLAMDMEIVNAENQETVLTHTFDRKLSLIGSKVHFLPQKISEILYEEFMKIAAEYKNH